MKNYTKKEYKRNTNAILNGDKKNKYCRQSSK